MTSRYIIFGGLYTDNNFTYTNEGKAGCWAYANADVVADWKVSNAANEKKRKKKKKILLK